MKNDLGWMTRNVGPVLVDHKTAMSSSITPLITLGLALLTYLIEW